MSVAWYLPNLIGYIRISFTLLAVGLIFKYPPLGMALGIISQILDAADGTLARRLNQCSAFGNILDYTIDRMFVACWMIVLAVFYPNFCFLFILILSLDLISHLFHMYASLQEGKNTHKEKDKYQGQLLQFYYSTPGFMFAVCFLHDLWIAALILYHFYSCVYFGAAIVIFTPFLLFKVYIHVIQLISSCRLLIDMNQLNFSAKRG